MEALVILVIAAFASLNVGLTLFNGFTLGHNEGQADFHYPSFLTACHMLSSLRERRAQWIQSERHSCRTRTRGPDARSSLLHTVGSLLIMLAVPSQRTLSLAQLRRFWIPLACLAIFNSGTLVLNAASLQRISVSVNSVVRACLPLPQLLLAIAIERKPIVWTTIVIVLILCVCAGLSFPVRARTAACAPASIADGRCSTNFR